MVRPPGNLATCIACLNSQPTSSSLCSSAGRPVLARPSPMPFTLRNFQPDGRLGSSNIQSYLDCSKLVKKMTHCMSIQYLNYLLLNHLLPKLVHILQLLLTEALPPHVSDQSDAGGEDQALLRQETVLVPPLLALAEPPQWWLQWRFLPTLIRGRLASSPPSIHSIVKKKVTPPVLLGNHLIPCERLRVPCWGRHHHEEKEPINILVKWQCGHNGPW